MLGLIWLARCVAPGMFSEVADAETENGRPVMKELIEFSRQPPRIAAPAPCVAQDLPRPNGSSHIPCSDRFCARLKGRMDRFKAQYAGAGSFRVESLLGPFPIAFDQV